MNMLNVNSELGTNSSPAGGISSSIGGNNSRRVSLANLVSAQIELKRNRDSSFRTSSKKSFNPSFNVSLTRSAKESSESRILSTSENEMGGMSQSASNQLAIMFIKSTKENIDCQVKNLPRP